MSVLILVYLLVLLFVVVPVVIQAVKVINNKKVPDARRSSIAPVLVWLGGSVILFALALQAYAAYMWFATIITDNPGEADHVLSILWPAALGGVAAGFVMLSIGLVLHQLRLDDKK